MVGLNKLIPTAKEMRKEAGIKKSRRNKAFSKSLDRDRKDIASAIKLCTKDKLDIPETAAGVSLRNVSSLQKELHSLGYEVRIIGQDSHESEVVIAISWD